MGKLEILVRKGLLFSISKPTAKKALSPTSPQGKEIKKQLKSYFSRENKTFHISMEAKGTPFQQKVWKELIKIPYGQTKTYGELAQKLKTSPRAIGNACSKNPVLIVIPCHRVIAKAGKGGFSFGGLKAKNQLLNLEQSLASRINI